MVISSSLILTIFGALDAPVISFSCFESNTISYNPRNVDCNFDILSNLDRVPTFLNNGVNISPNPGNRRLQVINQRNIAIHEIQFLNYMGQPIKIVFDQVDNLEISFLETGSYFLKVLWNDGKQQISSFVKQ